LFDEMQKVSMAAEGSRNDTLNTAAYSLGQLIAGGVLDESLAINSLKSSAITCGLSQKEIDQTIKSGISAGMKEPRIPELKHSNKSAGKPKKLKDKKFKQDSNEDDIPKRIPAGEIDPVSNKVVLSTDNTLPTAQAFIRDFETINDSRTLHSYNEYLFKWQKNRYSIYEYEAMKKRLHEWLHNALQYIGKGKKTRLEHPVILKK